MEMLDVTYIDGGVTAPRGFRAAGIAAGIRVSGRKDVALIAAERSVPAACVFTTNAMAAAPVLVSREHITSGRARAVVVNAGNANACTGDAGLADARLMARTAARALGCDEREIIVASTGVIGERLPVERVCAGIEAAARALTSDGSGDAAEAIMTTDTHPKSCALRVKVGEHTYAVGGIAKGSGMIQPDMATMLAFITTDAPLTEAACSVALRSAVERTFNRITVDSDTSTNDMCALIASGATGGPAIEPGDERFSVVAEAVRIVAAALATMIVRDGEGATKLIRVTVFGALDEGDAARCAFAIANSPLVKTAIFGGDANWGRVAAAVGRSGARIDPRRLSIRFAGIVTCEGGAAVPFSEDAVASALASDEVAIDVDLGIGEASATVLTCDLTYEYIRINGEYRS